LFSIEVTGRTGVEVLPVLVPIEFNRLNIQKGQRFQFKLEVDELSVLRTRDLDKV
jgi:hypothetical protein